MKYSIRTVLVLTAIISVVLVTYLKYAEYQEWRLQYRLTNLTIHMRDSQSNITHPPSEHFLVPSNGEPSKFWLHVAAGYFNHAGHASGEGSWNAMPTITSNEEMFSYVVETPAELAVWNGNSPYIKTSIEQFKVDDRKSALRITVDLLDSGGQVIDSKTETITISDKQSIIKAMH